MSATVPFGTESQMHVYSFRSDQTGSYPSLEGATQCLAICGDEEHKQAAIRVDRIAWRTEEQENMKNHSF